MFEVNEPDEGFNSFLTEEKKVSIDCRFLWLFGILLAAFVCNEVPAIVVLIRFLDVDELGFMPLLLFDPNDDWVEEASILLLLAAKKDEIVFCALCGCDFFVEGSLISNVKGVKLFS